jgi:hypothetical protein
MNNEPPVLDYRRPAEKPPTSSSPWWFFAGLGAGCAISAFAYLVIGPQSNAKAPAGAWVLDPGSTIYLVLFLKVVLAAFMLSTRRFRFGGLGLLISLPLGFMIFFTACANGAFAG